MDANSLRIIKQVRSLFYKLHFISSNNCKTCRYVETFEHARYVRIPQIDDLKKSSVIFDPNERQSAKVERVRLFRIGKKIVFKNTK